jgi:superoxide dismutase, Cu-Zn family
MNKARKNVWLQAVAGCAVLASAACAEMTEVGVEGSAPALSDDSADYESKAWTELRNAAGERVGRASFVSDGEATYVTVTAQLPAELEGIHGMHVHANDVADNGEGCIADPNAEPSTHFVSVDGHFNPHGESHGHHQGDMPALFVGASGDAYLQFRTDHFQPDELRGRALIVHAASDNYGNIPLGDADNQYTANSDAATDLTGKTGNAGARLACGVIQ